MSIKLFITGTDTDVGKTYISVGILTAFNRMGMSTLGVKPVASGCHQVNGALYNDDAIALQLASSIKLEYEQINPFAFEPPIAPHIAAQLAHRDLNVALINQQTRFALEFPVDVCLVEGAGGWLTPLNDNETMADVVKSNQLKVILVVGMRLGCINHAMLTMRVMQSDNIDVVGWIANCIDPDMKYPDESIATLKHQFSAPNLGIVRHMSRPESAIDIGQFFNPGTE